jgi:hypothetical protein
MMGFQPLRLLTNSLSPADAFSVSGPWSKMIARDVRSLDVPAGTLPFTSPTTGDPASQVCMIHEPWTLDWFLSWLFYCFVAVPFIAWTITPLRLTILFLATLVFGVAFARRLLPVESPPMLAHARVAAMFAAAPSILLPAMAQVIYAFWWSLDYSRMTTLGTAYTMSGISFGPFAYGVANAGSMLLGLFVAMWAAKRAVTPKMPATRSWRRIRTSLLVASVLCYTYPLTSGWINLLIPGPPGEFWLPF